MRYVDEYRDFGVARGIAAEIRRRVRRPWVIMEICGGQTHAIMRYGLDELLPAEVELVHGPGCPVCVTPIETIDAALDLAARPRVTLVSYGDMLRVPGSRTDLFHVKAEGGDVRIAYAPVEALRIARDHPERKVVFFGIGFETTAPANAAALARAKAEGFENFSMLVSHMRVPPALRLLLGSPENRVQGFIGPGHVCTVMGLREYEGLAREFRVPIVVGGFEPVDLLEAVRRLIVQLEEGRAEVENAYGRSVRPEGNPEAKGVMEAVFEVCDRKWRGIGLIPKSGLRPRASYARFDAERVFSLEEHRVEEPPECVGALVLQGLRKPTACTAFGGRCTPEHPLGALMVSAEGACAAYWRYRRPPPGGAGARA